MGCGGSGRNGGTGGGRGSGPKSLMRNFQISSYRRFVPRSGVALSAILTGVLLLGGCGGKNKKQQARGADTSAEPDKVLFERAEDDIKHGRLAVARLTLQTLLNA